MSKALACLALGLMMMATSALATTIYRTTDAQGNVTFTDQPDRGGEQVELAPLTVVPSRGEVRRTEPERVESREAPRRDRAPGQPFMPYDTFRIVSPEHEETLPTGYAGDVAVELAIEPALREDHQVRLLVGGEVSQSAMHTSAFMLTGLYRGEHVLQAELLDASGEVRHRTEPVTLYVQRASVNLPRIPTARISSPLAGHPRRCARTALPGPVATSRAMKAAMRPKRQKAGPRRASGSSAVATGHRSSATCFATLERDGVSDRGAVSGQCSSHCCAPALMVHYLGAIASGVRAPKRRRAAEMLVGALLASFRLSAGALAEQRRASCRFMIAREARSGCKPLFKDWPPCTNA